ncbi:MAG: biotin transporter BioY [Deltaproteobacteria bacterium]|nr:biotin transporter BioY [Deltaproteobacteria bacterium]
MTRAMTAVETRRLVRLAVWASLIGLGAWIALPVGSVPVTLQTFFIFLAAFVEGPAAAAACGVYLLAGLLGLPVFTGGRVGPALLFGPTAGFALAFPLMAAAAGLARGGAAGLTVSKCLLFGLLGLLALYFFGALGLMANMNASAKGAFWLAFSFLPADGAKLVCAALVAMRVGAGRSLKTGAASEKSAGG